MQEESGQLVHSEACERNKGVILEVLRGVLQKGDTVLEIGSGTGQHIAHFAAALPATVWQPADTGEYLPGLRARLNIAALDNILPLLEIDVRMEPWPTNSVNVFDAVFSANTLHFMSTDCVRDFFRGVAQVLKPEGHLIVYGPFNYNGQFTSDSNQRFQQWLQSGDPARGIRDFEWVNELAEARGLRLLQDCEMPANNRTLVWQRLAGL